MHRFYFDLIGDREIFVDDVGVYADNIEEAIEQAKIVINEMKAGGELAYLKGGWRFHIASDDRTIFSSITITESIICIIIFCIDERLLNALPIYVF
ncbi:hypothetical protein FF100_36040 [Methylobacterium terricola]|uniref:DUF6894 domain-containing protein n=1 Tax=Methylobacterium terricola TaxID=2583531 RepID=A0A5C4L549_9HYPH|nr:hypothetical protein [Methylobacterium terricola]TNC05223.1 hypothetical protein FF100_36040 [Methylobacterium terricola]